MSVAEMIEFVKKEKARAEHELKFREDSVRIWSGGTDKSWKAVGCNMTKKQHLGTSAIHARISIKCRSRVEILEEIIDYLTPTPNPRT